jgi:hypothetical protein
MPRGLPRARNPPGDPGAVCGRERFEQNKAWSWQPRVGSGLARTDSVAAIRKAIKNYLLSGFLLLLINSKTIQNTKSS